MGRRGGEVAEPGLFQIFLPCAARLSPPCEAKGQVEGVISQLRHVPSMCVQWKGVACEPSGTGGVFDAKGLQENL